MPFLLRPETSTFHRVARQPVGRAAERPSHIADSSRLTGKLAEDVRCRLDPAFQDVALETLLYPAVVFTIRLLSTTSCRGSQNIEVPSGVKILQVCAVRHPVESSML